MQLKKNSRYKHRNNTDVAIEVLGIIRFTDEGISLIVSWWNIHFKPPSKIVPYQVILIKKDQIKDWENIDANF